MVVEIVLTMVVVVVTWWWRTGKMSRWEGR
jgi:hypothetical protein